MKINTKVKKWESGKCTFTVYLNKDVEKTIWQLVILYKRIEPLLNFAEVICKQVDLRPIETAVNVQVGGYSDENVPEWLAIRKKAAAEINPETAKVSRIDAQTLDPYGVNRYLPSEFGAVGREYFARAPGSDVWVLFDDLSSDTATALWKRYSSK